jgi:hypothetical protein
MRFTYTSVTVSRTDHTREVIRLHAHHLNLVVSLAQGCCRHAHPHPSPMDAHGTAGAVECELRYFKLVVAETPGSDVPEFFSNSSLIIVTRATQPCLNERLQGNYLTSVACPAQ